MDGGDEVLPHLRVFLCIRCRKKGWSIGILCTFGDTNLVY